MAILRSAPEPRGSMRPWLAQVLRNFRRKGLREESRRRTREVGATLLQEDEVASTENLLARLELQRMVSELLRDLDEPYRTTVLRRFFEGHTPTEMARAQGIPAGTVRWRLNEGLRRLRARLDEAHGGNRDSWKAILVAPVAAPAARTGTKLSAPASVPVGLRTGAWLAVGALLPAMVAGVLLSRPRPVAPTPSQAQEATDTSDSKNRMNALLDVVLPALVASADASAAPERQPAASQVAAPACVPGDNAAGCIPRILRSELPAAVENALARAIAGRKPEELTIEPRLRKG
jgi:RNA polymerase sigma factor (sigma-70 family)